VSALDVLSVTDYDAKERYPRIVIGDDPAAGVEISVTVPGGRFWEILAVTLTLVTDATAANRRPTLLIDDGTTVALRSLSRADQTASITGRLCWADFGNTVGTTGGTEQQVSLPAGLVVAPGWRIRSSTDLLQAGDNYAAPLLWVREIAYRGERSQVEYELMRALRRLLIEAPYFEETET